MIRIAKSLLGRDNYDEGLEHLNSIQEQVGNGLSPQERAVIGYLTDAYGVHSRFPTPEIFLGKFPEYIQSYNDEENGKLDNESLSYYVYEYIHNKRKQIAARKMMEFSSTITTNSQGLTQDMVESLREFIVTNDDPVDETKTNVIDLYRENKKRREELGEFKTYVPELDNILKGIEAGKVHIISGFTGCGKSTFALNMAYKNARDGHSIVYISLEMSQQDILYNMISLHSLDPKFKRPPIPSSAIRSCTMTEEQEEHFMRVSEDYNETIAPNLRILTEVSFLEFSYGEVREILYRLDDIKPIEAIFVDQANLLKFYGKKKFNSVGDAINEYISFFRRLSLCFRKTAESKRELTVFILCQCNRQGYLRAKNQKDQHMKGMYDMTAIAEANEIERASSTIMMIYSDDDLKLVEEARAQILKSRFGRCQSNPVSIYFRPEFSQIGELTDKTSKVKTREEADTIFSQLQNIDAASIGFDMSSLSLDLGD